MTIWYGIILSLATIVVFPLNRLEIGGIILAVIIIDALGLGVNKAVLEIYRLLARKEKQKLLEAQ